MSVSFKSEKKNPVRLQRFRSCPQMLSMRTFEFYLYSQSSSF